MSLATKLFFWELINWIDDNINHSLDKYAHNFPEWLEEMRFNFCQWGHNGWLDTMDKIVKNNQYVLPK